MSASSINRKVAEVEKAKKVERRNAIIQRYESENDIIKHIEAEKRGIPAETSGSDSPVVSEEIKETKAKKAPSKKGSARRLYKKILSNS